MFREHWHRVHHAYQRWFRIQQLAVLQALLDCAEEGHWETLARRRVCHFGYKFEYQVGYLVWPQMPWHLPLMHNTQLSTVLSTQVPFLTLLFLMQSRNVDPQKPGQPFPAALQPVLERLQHVPDMPQVRFLLLTTAAQHPHM